MDIDFKKLKLPEKNSLEEKNQQPLWKKRRRKSHSAELPTKFHSIGQLSKKSFPTF